MPIDLATRLLATLVFVTVLTGCATQSGGDEALETPHTTSRQAESNSSDGSDTAASEAQQTTDKPSPGTLERCPESRQESGTSCRRTTVDGEMIEIVLTVGGDTEITGEGTMPSELARYRFLGHLKRYQQCALDAATSGWRGMGTAMIELEIDGSKVADAKTRSQQLPETFTTCVTETTRRLRFTRAPDGDIRIVQPLHVEIGPPDAE